MNLQPRRAVSPSPGNNTRGFCTTKTGTPMRDIFAKPVGRSSYASRIQSFVFKTQETSSARPSKAQNSRRHRSRFDCRPLSPWRTWRSRRFHPRATPRETCRLRKNPRNLQIVCRLRAPSHSSRQPSTLNTQHVPQSAIANRSAIGGCECSRNTSTGFGAGSSLLRRASFWNAERYASRWPVRVRA
jgi:hypothetical protein